MIRRGVLYYTSYIVHYNDPYNRGIPIKPQQVTRNEKEILNTAQIGLPGPCLVATKSLSWWTYLQSSWSMVGVLRTTLAYLSPSLQGWSSGPPVRLVLHPGIEHGSDAWGIRLMVPITTAAGGSQCMTYRHIELILTVQYIYLEIRLDHSSMINHAWRSSVNHHLIDNVDHQRWWFFMGGFIGDRMEYFLGLFRDG